MTIYLPDIGVPYCGRALSFVRNYPQNVVGSFWLMCGYGFDTKNIPSWWEYLVTRENQAAAILDVVKSDDFGNHHDNPLYLGFCIIIISNPENPINLSYMIQHLRMESFEGIALLELMAEHNIPAHTEVTYPEHFLEYRYQCCNPHKDDPSSTYSGFHNGEVQ